MLPARTCAAWPLCLVVFTTTGCFHDFDEPFSGSGGSAGAGEGATGGGGAGPSTGGGGDDRPGGSGGSAMTGLPEDCGNGADDDGDSLVDCDDTADCPGLTCIAHPGEEWEGPLVLYVGSEPNAPVCPNDLPPVADKNTTLFTPPAICNTGCSCSGPQGGTCGAVTISVYAQTNCGGAAEPYLEMVDELCHDEELSGPLGDRYRSNVVTATGSCTPFGGAQPVIADATFSQWGRACDAGTGGTCGGGGVCAASAGPLFQQGTLCFGRAGDQDCPVDLPVKHLLSDSVTDDRTCEPCACEPATGRTCDGRIHIFESPGCGGQKSDFDLDGTCASPNIILPSAYRFDLENPQGGDCAPTGGTVTGAVVTNGDYTVCCDGSPG